MFYGNGQYATGILVIFSARYFPQTIVDSTPRNGSPPFSLWHGLQVKLPTMFSFVQFGYMPKLTRHGKMTSLSLMGHFIGMCDMSHVTIQLSTVRIFDT